MTVASDLFLFLAKAAVLVTGFTIVFYTARAAHHTDDRGLWLLTLGIGLAGIGLLLTGLLSALLGLATAIDTTITSMIAAVGLALVIYSMFTDPHVPVQPK